MIKPEMPFWHRSCTLGRVRDGVLTHTHDITGPTGKESVLKDARESDVLFVAWTGKWTTDLFVVEPADRMRLLAERGK